jgi:chromosome segregation ATPase
MAMPALKLEAENPVEERVARLEVNVERILLDVSDMKTDIRQLNNKVDAVDKKLSDKIDGVDSLKDALAALTLRVEKGFADMKASHAMDRVWWLLTCAAMLGVMAHGFKWL